MYSHNKIKAEAGKMSFLNPLKIVFSVFVMIGFMNSWCSADEETVCSKFHYEEQLLEKMMRMEFKVEQMESEIKKTQVDMIATLEGMSDKMERFADSYKELAENISKTQEKNNAYLETFQRNLKDDFDSYIEKHVETRVDEKLEQMEQYKNNSINDMNIFKQDLKTEIDIKKTEVDSYQEDSISEVKEIIDNVTNTVDQKLKDMELLEVKLGNPTVAFNVHSPEYTRIGTGEVIVFTATILNKGDCYNTTSGKFSASMTGLYYFSAHVCNVAGKFVHYGIFVNDKVIAVSSQREDTDSSCGSVSAVSMVIKGQQVWVQILSGGSEQQLNENTYRWNSFNGAMLN